MAFVVVQGLWVCLYIMFKGVVASLRVQLYSRPDPGVTHTMFLLIYFFSLSFSCNYSEAYNPNGRNVDLWSLVILEIPLMHICYYVYPRLSVDIHLQYNKLYMRVYNCIESFFKNCWTVSMDNAYTYIMYYYYTVWNIDNK